MKRPKGPELKMPDLKGITVPTFLEDVYWDLRDRRLLPLVALVVVATAAVPFLLGGSAEEPLPTGRAALSAAEAAEQELADAASLTVVEAKPGLRDYRKRLARHEPTDPFKQLYTASVVGAGAKLNPQTETTTSGESTSTTETTPPETGDSGGGSSPGSPPEGGGVAKQPELTLFAFAIDVRIVRSGGKSEEAQAESKKAEPVVKRRVLPVTPLPGEKAAVVTYMGPSEKGKALLLVSTDVKSVFGEVKCVFGDDVCQLLEAEPGFPVTFVYGGNEVHYTINVLKIEPVVVGRE